MPAPSTPFTAIASTDIDKSSPNDEPLSGAIYDRLIYLKEVTYGTGTKKPATIDGIPWTDLDRLDPDDPNPAAWWRAVVNNLEHLRRYYIRKNADGFGGDVPHDHTRADNGFAEPGEAFNFIRNACPYQVDDESNGSFNGSFLKWVRRGANVSGHNIQLAEAGHFIAQVVLQDPLQRTCFGGGADFVVSMFVRSLAAQSEGTMSFGLSSGGETANLTTSVELQTTPGDATESAVGYDVGARARLDFSDLSTNWRRYYCRMTDVLKRPSSEVRFQVSVDESLTESVRITGFAMTYGDVLHPFMFSPVERWHGSQTDGETDKEFVYLNQYFPVFDWVVGMTNAIEVRAV